MARWRWMAWGSGCRGGLSRRDSTATRTRQDLGALYNARARCKLGAISTKGYWLRSPLPYRALVGVSGQCSTNVQTFIGTRKKERRVNRLASTAR